jgi:ATP-dependent HslUV protease ATP-binding subunit HslU
VRILKEPKNALLEQYRRSSRPRARRSSSRRGVDEIARIAMRLNDRMENIGARRLQTVMTTLLEDVLFDLPDKASERFVVDAEFVRGRLMKVAEDEDLSRYIL